MRRRQGPRPEGGQVAGIETLLIGVVILLVGLLVAVNAWAYLQRRAALHDTAHEVLRVYTSPTNETDDAARRAAMAELHGALERRGRRPDDVRVELTLSPGFGPCAEVTIDLSAGTPLIDVPLLGSIGAAEITVHRSELLPPAGQRPDAAYRRRLTPCYAD